MTRPGEGRVMLVTGSRKGIGRGLVERYVAAGFTVYGCSRKAAEPLDGYHHYLTDVGDEVAVRAMLADIRDRSERLDVLVNNAGIGAMNHALLTPTSAVAELMRVNVVAAFTVIREAARMMRDGNGRIVNFTSVAVPLKLEGEAAYAASKAAVIALTEVLARELAGFGITVNAVGPGPVDTDLLRGVGEDRVEQLLARLAIHEMGTIEDVGNVIDFLIDPQSRLVTGQSIFLGGP